MEKIKTLLITQARIGSTRFPKKVLQKIADKTLLGLHLERIKNAKLVSKIVVATTEEIGVEEIVQIANQLEIPVFQGSLNDVLDRFYQAATFYQPDYIIRVTSDCPLLDPNLIDEVIGTTIESGADYGSNTLIEEYPDGQDVEVFKFSALEYAWRNANLSSEREHVTPFIRKNSKVFGGSLFEAIHFPSSENFNHIRMSVDEPIDLDAINKLVSLLGIEESWINYTNYMINNINLFENQDIKRNEGYLKSLNHD